MYPEDEDAEFQKLSPDEQKAELHRLLQVANSNPHPQRAAALRDEFRRIREERRDSAYQIRPTPQNEEPASTGAAGAFNKAFKTNLTETDYRRSLRSALAREASRAQIPEEFSETRQEQQSEPQSREDSDETVAKLRPAARQMATYMIDDKMLERFAERAKKTYAWHTRAFWAWRRCCRFRYGFLGRAGSGRASRS